MKHADFHIGLEFLASGGFRWRCTDVGTRTILAIHLDRKDSHWYQGPPYIAKEVVFDEKEMARCHLSEIEAITAAFDELKNGHPGYPSDVVRKMLEARFAHRYPHKGVLRFDRRRADGEILHPYAGRKEGEAWIIDLYLPFQRTFESMSEVDFIALPRASADDVRSQAQERHQQVPSQDE